MIMITLYIVLWLLSGFLAAWIGHNVDPVNQDTSILAVMVMSACGGFTVLLLILYFIFDQKVLSKPLFKAKETK